jgi:hypothetical protein
MNFDFDARVKSFSVPLPPGAVPTNVGFHDVDGNAATDWTVTVGKRLTWSAPTGAATQDYGTLLNFRLTVNAAPTAVDGSSVKIGSLESRALLIEPTIVGPGTTLRPAP